MPRIVGRKPSPRAIVWDFDPETAQRLADLFPTSVILSGGIDVRLAEWDVIVTKGGIGGNALPRHLFVVSFGDGDLGQAATTPTPQSISFGSISNATEFEIPAGLDPTVARLVNTDLIPIAEAQGANSYASSEKLSYTAALGRSGVTPFLQTTEPRILAGSFRRPFDEAHLWFLPLGANPVAWVSAAIAAWRAVNGERFPSPLDWSTGSEWQTPSEHAASVAIDDLTDERSRLIAALDQQSAQAEVTLAAAREAADLTERRLLTSQGTTLVGAAIEAFRALGFTVIDMDTITPETDRLEDLRISAPEDDPHWEAIAEVRGYASGAKVSDLIRIHGRFAPRYTKEKGHPPSASWYIANQFLKLDPSLRSAILETNPDEVSEFGASDGLAIDTRDLLRLWLAVQRAAISPADARRLLRDAFGRFRFPERQPVGVIA